MRRLLVTRRHVPLDLSDDYLLAWDGLRSRASAVGARAWLFRSDTHDDRFLEFIEWPDGAAPPLEDEAVAEARARLGDFARAEDETEWEEQT